MRNRTERFDAAELWRGLGLKLQGIVRMFKGSSSDTNSSGVRLPQGSPLQSQESLEPHPDAPTANPDKPPGPVMSWRVFGVQGASSYHALGEVSDWQCSPCFGVAAGQQAPTCPKCGHPVRTDGSQRQSVSSGMCHLPWNAGWDGACESCGHRFEAIYNTRNGDTRTRAVRFEPAQELWPVWIDYCQVFAGVKITVVDEGAVGERTTQQTIFLRMPELIRLAEALKGELNICQFQYDWDEDWT